MKNFRIHAALAISIAVIYCTATADSVDFTAEVSFGSDSQAGASTWAVNVPSLTITLLTTDFPSSTAAIVTAKHQLQDGTETAMCQVQLTGTTNQCNPCSPQPANFGVVCNRNTSSTVEIIITLGGLDQTRAQSKILLQQGSIPAADWGYDYNSTLITLDGCDLSAFEGAVADDSSACGYNCTRDFSCSSSGYTGTNFTKSCTVLASWDDDVTTCSLVCNNDYFVSDAEPVNDTIVGAGGIKTFNCNCQQSSATSQSFERTCGTDGNWTDKSSSCEPVCSAATITCGTLSQSSNQTLLCGGQDYEFSCTNNCSGTFNLQCEFDGTWNSTDCYCPQACSADEITCGTLVQPTDQTVVCGGQDYEFTCNASPKTFNLQCEFDGNWKSTDCFCSEVFFTAEASFGSDSQTGASTWAVNIPSLTITLRTTNFPSSTAAIVTAKHQLQDGNETAMCQIQLTGTTNQCNTCSPQPANFGVVCNRNTSSTVEIIITLGGLDQTRDQSKILLQQGSIPAADWGYDSDSTLITLDVCDLSLFEGAVAEDNSACGYNCNRDLSCSSGYIGMDFTRRCTALASWDDDVTTCSLVCNNGYFVPDAEPVDDTIVGAGGDKTFNCKCQQSNVNSQSFERTCGTDGNWTNKSSSCEPVCGAADITCGTLAQSKNQARLCGGQDYEFSCTSDCSATFSLQCDFDGNWNSTDCYCPQVCRASNITCATPVQPTNETVLCGVRDYEFSCNTTCPQTFNLQCEFDGNWNSTDCYCSEDYCGGDAVESRASTASVCLLTFLPLFNLLVR